MKIGLTHWLCACCVSSLMVAQGPSLGLSRVQAAEVKAIKVTAVEVKAAVDQAAEDQAAEDQDFQATHQQSQILKLLENDKPIETVALAGEATDEGPQESPKNVRARPWQVKSFCLTADDQLLVAVGGSQGELRLLSPDGEFLKAWSLPVVPDAINVDAAGDFLVAGQGQVFKINTQGEVLLHQPSPVAAAIQNNRDAVRQEVIAQLKSSARSVQRQQKLYAQRIDAMIEKAASNLTDDEQAELKILKRQVASHEDADVDALSADELNALNLRNVLIRMLHTKAEKTVSELEARRLQMYRQQLVMTKQYLRDNGSGDPSDEEIQKVIVSLIERKSQVASISAGDGDVFLATGAIKGYGYDVWRMNDQLEEPENIVTGLRGCCGQMDVQGNEHGVFVAENSRHRVCHFDREGERVKEWGERARSGVRGFGGCCNPMNLTFGSDGSIYAAESTTGRIKQFSLDGQLKSLVGSVELVPGCKKVSIGVNSSGDRVYMLDITRNHIVVMNSIRKCGELPRHCVTPGRRQDVLKSCFLKSRLVTKARRFAWSGLLGSVRRFARLPQ